LSQCGHDVKACKQPHFPPAIPEANNNAACAFHEVLPAASFASATRRFYLPSGFIVSPHMQSASHRRSISAKHVTMTARQDGRKMSLLNGLCSRSI
jgi:hypothetical protein